MTEKETGPRGPQLASATHLAYFMPMAIVVCMFGGRWIGGKYGHAEGGLIWGFFVGVVLAFYEAFKVQKQIRGGRGPQG